VSDESRMPKGRQNKKNKKLVHIPEVSRTDSAGNNPHEL
jgi:hypothetical protein